MKSAAKRILLGCGAVTVTAIVVLVGLIFFAARSWQKSVQPVTDISHYSEIKAKWPSNLVSHFPAEAPNSAVFFFQPGFLQGGSSLQLKVEMSESKIATELSKISNRILATYHGGNVNTHANLTNGIPTTFFFTSETDNSLFPNDYTIMVVATNNRGGGLSWNHGSTAGIAISTQRQVVVYWAEDW
jgi:hypothetical protein